MSFFNIDDDDNTQYSGSDDDEEYEILQTEIYRLRSLRGYKLLEEEDDNVNSGDEIICCREHDVFAKKIGAYLPTETDDYHAEIVCPWKKIWLYDSSGTFKDQDRTKKHANHYHDYLDVYMKKKFFEIFAVKPCEKCYNPAFTSCNPVCAQPIVKSPLVKRSSMNCLLTNFNICVGRCIYDDELAYSHIVCACFFNNGNGNNFANKYRQSCTPGFKRHLIEYNKENDQGQRGGWQHFLVLAEYAEILTEFVGWLNQAYPNIDIKMGYNVFKNENSDFMKIKFDVVSNFRYLLRKKFLAKAGLMEENNFVEYPPICR